MANNLSKSIIHSACIQYMERKINALLAELKEVQASATSETKSSMGDKYETGREMMMQERNRLGDQLNIQKEHLAVLNAIDPHMLNNVVGHGCVVKTDRAIFFISAAAGQIEVEGSKVFLISGNAPLAKAMMGRQQQESFSFNQQSYTIESID